MSLISWTLGIVGATAVAFCALLLMYADVYWGLAFALGASGATALGMASAQERRERGQLHLRHCIECGASVPEQAGFCPRCHSVRLEQSALEGAPDNANTRRAGREMPVTAYSADASGVIGWVDSAPPGTWAESYAPRHLRRWGIALLALAAVASAAGVFRGV